MFLLLRSKPYVKQVTWTGHLVRAMGISPHPGRFQAFVDTKPTSRCQESSAFPGYVQQFITIHTKSH